MHVCIRYVFISILSLSLSLYLTLSLFHCVSDRSAVFLCVYNPSTRNMFTHRPHIFVSLPALKWTWLVNCNDITQMVLRSFHLICCLQFMRPFNSPLLHCRNFSIDFGRFFSSWHYFYAMTCLSLCFSTPHGKKTHTHKATTTTTMKNK